MDLDQIMTAAFELVEALDVYLHRVNEAEKLGLLADEKGHLEDYEAALVLTSEQISAIKAEQEIKLQELFSCIFFAEQLNAALIGLNLAKLAYGNLFREPSKEHDQATPEELFAAASDGLVELNGQRARSYAVATLLYSDFVINETLMALRRLTPAFARPDDAPPDAIPAFNAANWFEVCKYLCAKLQSFETADTVRELLYAERDEAAYLLEDLHSPAGADNVPRPTGSKRAGGRPAKWAKLDAIIRENPDLADSEIAQRYNSGQWMRIEAEPSLKADVAKVRERRNELNRKRTSLGEK